MYTEKWKDVQRRKKKQKKDKINYDVFVIKLPTYMYLLSAVWVAPTTCLVAPGVQKKVAAHTIQTYIANILLTTYIHMK